MLVCQTDCGERWMIKFDFMMKLDTGLPFLRVTAVPAGTAEQVMEFCMGILSVCLSVTTRY